MCDRSETMHLPTIDICVGNHWLLGKKIARLTLIFSQ